jgi:hypothetical protein
MERRWKNGTERPSWPDAGKLLEPKRLEEADHCVKPVE